MLGGPQSTTPPMSCYRTVDSTGTDIAGADVPHQIDHALATKMYSTMAALQIVDTVFYEAQRQVKHIQTWQFCIALSCAEQIP